jgi:Tol biopolymer transport system component
MRNRGTWLLAALPFFSVLVVTCGAQSLEERKAFPPGILLIGTKTRDDPNACEIGVISPTGGEIRTIFRRETGSTFPGGRLSRQGDRLAVCYVTSGDKGEFVLIKPTGEATKIMDGVGTITAWAPDGQQLAFYQAAPNGDSFESFVIDLNSGERTKLELPADYVEEDWSPIDSTRTAIYMNPRNLLYREKKGDHYPTRQLDLMTADGTRTPITKNPSTDNIWARFSPDGSRLAHYGRRLVGEKSLEYAVVCSDDGSQPKEVFNFTEFGDKAGLPWFRPNGPPAWSPDGSTLAWLVSTNTEPKSQGERLELVFISADGGEPRRLSLTDLGFQRVAAVEWR